MTSEDLFDYIEALRGWASCPICQRQWEDTGTLPGFGNFVVLEFPIGPQLEPQFQRTLVCDDCFAVIANCTQCRYGTSVGCSLRPPPVEPEDEVETRWQPSYGVDGSCAAWTQHHPVSYAWQVQIAEENGR